MKISFQDHNVTIHLVNTLHCEHHTVIDCENQQLPEFERVAAFIFKYQVVTSESESQVRLFSPFPTLTDVNIDGVHAIFLESNEKLSRMQYRVTQAGCNNLTFNESHIPVIQQMDNVYK